MSLKLMYITNRPEVALIAEENGVDRIFVDMEYIGKAKRQGNLDTVQNHHTIQDIAVLRQVLTRSELLVRVNPIHEKTDAYCSSEEEIEAAIRAGADILMLPFFKTVAEVKRFLRIVDGRARTMLLLETPEAVEALDEILAIPGIDEIHIGINDLSIGYGKRFMFELLTDGTVERLCRKMQLAGMFYGFGGIASLGRGLVPAEMIIREHYRLGSRMAILSRSFCNVDQFSDLNAIEEIFFRGVREIRTLEKECAAHTRYFTDNRKDLDEAVKAVVSGMPRKEKPKCVF
ncbi:MAG: aldolase [Oscillospiraceae bacterium]|nr:aldolase [Oscillospiraceae bacterium]